MWWSLYVYEGFNGQLENVDNDVEQVYRFTVVSRSFAVSQRSVHVASSQLQSGRWG